MFTKCNVELLEGSLKGRDRKRTPTRPDRKRTVDCPGSNSSWFHASNCSKTVLWEPFVRDLTRNTTTYPETPISQHLRSISFRNEFSNARVSLIHEIGSGHVEPTVRFRSCSLSVPTLTYHFRKITCCV